MEQFIVESPDSRTSLLLKELFRKMNLTFVAKKSGDSISGQEKQMVLDRLQNSKEEDDLDWKDVKKNILKK
jgi:hypothetical protein